VKFILSFLIVFIAMASVYSVKADEPNTKLQDQLTKAFLAKAGEPDVKLQAELIKTLNIFADEHSITSTALEGMLGRLVLDQIALSKGGVGIIDKDTFILLKEKRNTLVISGRKWEGKKASEQEIVLADGQHILDSLQKADLSKATIVLFSPSEVQFISLSTTLAGKYKR